MRRPFIFTSLGVVRGESKRGNRKCGPENTIAENMSTDPVPDTPQPSWDVQFLSQMSDLSNAK